MDRSTGLPQVVLMCGVAGAGKTTFARRLEDAGYVRLSIDEEVWQVFGRFGIDYSPHRYEHFSAVAEERLRDRLVSLIGAGANVVVDLSLWQKEGRDTYKRLIEMAGAVWRLVYLPVPPDELRRRLAARSVRFDANAAFPIDETLLAHYIASFQVPMGEGEEVITWPPSSEAPISPAPIGRLPSDPSA